MALETKSKGQNPDRTDLSNWVFELSQSRGGSEMKNVKGILLVASLFLLPGLALANGTVSGKVTDAETGEGLVGAGSDHDIGPNDPILLC